MHFGEPVDEARFDTCIRRAYDKHQFPVVAQTLNALVTVDLSAFYVDATKDRMYTYGARSTARPKG